jgi:glycosyltransferase involved in cell wall biosynthesis
MKGRLCWICHRDPENPRAGGAEKSILEISRGLTELGWEVQLIAAGFAGAKVREQIGPINVIRGSGAIMMHAELPRLMASCRPYDIVIEDLGHVVPFLAERFTHGPGIVFFRHLHRRTLRGQVGGPAATLLQLLERAYPLIYSRWPVVAPSPSALGDLEAIGFQPSRLHQIPYGVDSELFHPGGLTDFPSLIYFSGLRKYKRPDHALRVLAALRDVGLDARLTVVGRGPELANLQTLSRELQIAKYVTFTGWLAESDLAALVGQSWLHIQCSTAEGWGLTAWEAAAAGVPTVAYRVAGLIDSVQPGVSGSLVPDGNLAALTSAALEILGSRQVWTTRSRQCVIGRTWKDAATRWDDLLGRVAQTG